MGDGEGGRKGGRMVSQALARGDLTGDLNAKKRERERLVRWLQWCHLQAGPGTRLPALHYTATTQSGRPS